MKNWLKVVVITMTIILVGACGMTANHQRSSSVGSSKKVLKSENASNSGKSQGSSPSLSSVSSKGRATSTDNGSMNGTSDPNGSTGQSGTVNQNGTTEPIGTTNTNQSNNSNSGSSGSAIGASSSDTSSTSSSSQGASSQGNGTSTPIQVVSNPTSLLVLVNKTHKLPEGYVPPNLIYPNVPFPYSSLVEKREMRDVAAHALEKLVAGAKKDGLSIYGESGYRSYTTQQSIFAWNVKTQGYSKASIVSAHPGTSEHQTGLAMDVTSSDVQDQLIQKFGDTPEGQWLAAHAHEYGFIIRYPKGKQNITGYEYEPWHIRYVGVAVATYIYQYKITFDQYIAQFGPNPPPSS